MNSRDLNSINEAFAEATTKVDADDTTESEEIVTEASGRKAPTGNSGTRKNWKAKGLHKRKVKPVKDEPVVDEPGNDDNE
jgi:hypothetical protein